MNAKAPIDGINASDAETVVIKLKIAKIPQSAVYVQIKDYLGLTITPGQPDAL